MYSQHPGIAKRWEKETPKVKLPDKKEDVEVEGIAPSMNSVFEAKGKKHICGPGEPTKVDATPDWIYKGKPGKPDETHCGIGVSLDETRRFVSEVVKILRGGTNGRL